MVVLIDKSAGIVAAHKPALDKRHGIDTHYLVHKDTALPFATLKAFKENLTMTPARAGADSTDNSASFSVWREDGDYIRVPRYFGLSKFGYPEPDRDRRSLGAPMQSSVEFLGTLRQDPPQVPIVTALHRVMTSPVGGGMMQVGCGVGKTVCALYLAARLGRRTAVLVNNKTTLEPQWLERIAQFLPGARVGVLRQKRADLTDVDIVVCSIQSLIRHEYDADGMAAFGTVIVDEAHHIGAKQFSLCMRQFRARYTLGLTATPKRKDGLGRLVSWLMGPITVVLPTSFKHVSLLQYTWTDTKVRDASDRPAHVQRAQMVTQAIGDYARSVVMLRLIANCLKTTPGRTVLVLTERVDQVEYFAAWCRQQNPSWIVSRIHGNSPKEELATAKDTADVIVATYPMANEALDIAHIDTLALLTPPVGFVEQIVGRIIRIHDAKYVPLVLYLADAVGLFAGMARKFLNWARQQDFRFVHTLSIGTHDVEKRFDAIAPSALFADMGLLDKDRKVERPREIPGAVQEAAATAIATAPGQTTFQFVDGKFVGVMASPAWQHRAQKSKNKFKTIPK